MRGGPVHGMLEYAVCDMGTFQVPSDDTLVYYSCTAHQPPENCLRQMLVATSVCVV
jgi:hypothetical protein